MHARQLLHENIGSSSPHVCCSRHSSSRYRHTHSHLQTSTLCIVALAVHLAMAMSSLSSSTSRRVSTIVRGMSASSTLTWRSASLNLPSVTLLYIAFSFSSSMPSEYGCISPRSRQPNNQNLSHPPDGPCWVHHISCCTKGALVAPEIASCVPCECTSLESRDKDVHHARSTRQEPLQCTRWLASCTQLLNCREQRGHHNEQ